jgi:hypothetical protein
VSKAGRLKVDPKRLSGAVSKVVYSPTLLAYGWIIVHYQFAGFALYGIVMGLAYKMRLFEHARQWPISSQTALAVGPVLLAMGAGFSLMRVGYWMLIPGLAYMVLIIIGGLALKGKVFDGKAGE